MSLASAVKKAMNLKKGQKAMEDETEEDIVDDDDKTTAEGEEDNINDDESDDDETTAEGEEPDEEDEDADPPQARKAAYRKGYAAAQKRTAAILTSSKADANPELAAKLAFGADYQNLNAKAAIGVLNTAGGSNKGSLSDRMAGQKHGLAADNSGDASTGYDAGSLDDRMAKLNKVKQAKLTVVK